MKNKGFTTIELLVVIAIMAIISASIIPVYGGMQGLSQLNETKSQITQTLRLAREYSRSGFDNQSYGIFFALNEEGFTQFIMYQGDSFTSRDASFDRVYQIDKGVVVTTTFLGNEVHFSKNIGEPSNEGQVSLLGENGAVKSVSVNQYGFVSSL